MESWYLLFILLFCVILPSRQRALQRIVQRRRKGERRMIPSEMLREFTGKECAITLFNEIGAVQGKILAVEEKWIKVEEKKKIRLINGDMIRDIAIAKEK